MKIAIVGGYHYHLECIGFLCELLQEHEITICVIKDIYQYLLYFKYLFKNISIDLSFSSVKTCDKLILLTDNDNIVSVPDNDTFQNNFIKICHLDNDKSTGKLITLAPKIIPSRSTNYIWLFPLYKGICLNAPRNIILYIGYFIEDYVDDDFKQFCGSVQEKKVYTLTIATYKPVGFLEQYGFNIMAKCSTTNLVQILQHTSFVLLKNIKYCTKEIITGALPMAISHGIPVIVDKRRASDYNITDISITYEKDYCEVLDKIHTIQQNEYNLLQQNVLKLRDKVISENKDKLDAFL